MNEVFGELKKNLEMARQTVASRQIGDLRRAVNDILVASSCSHRVTVYLFGSWATGRFDSQSDIDLLVIAPTRREADSTQGQLMSIADDVVAYTSTVWDSRYAKNDPFVRRVTSERLFLAGAGEDAE